jgi:hypothetical protein
VWWGERRSVLFGARCDGEGDRSADCRRQATPSPRWWP